MAKKFDNQEYRQIFLKRGRLEENALFPSNYITTAKYSVWTLIPKNLYEQFHRVANIWFLIVSIFQVLPFNLSPTSSWATIAPLSLVLTVTLCKDAYQDYRRHQSDKEINNRLVKSWDEDSQNFVDKKWMDLQVGNLVKLTDNDNVPADLIVFATSQEENMCYIETSNLDGETNLKIRIALTDTASIFESLIINEAMKMVHKLDEAVLNSEHPNNRLYVYEGSLKIKGHPRSSPIDNGNVLLRGSTVRNTAWVLGCVVFTGPDTKLMMNSKHPPHKRSNVEQRVNKYLIIVFTLLFIMVIVSTVISIANTYAHKSMTEFFSGVKSSDSGLNFITFLILYNSLVPISLYVTMDVVRVMQAKFIQWDMRMYYAPIDRPAIAKTGDLNEDLGQIEYIFSDKTGTLTENQMEFKKCAIRGRVYGSMEVPINCSDVSLNPHPKFKFYDQNFLTDMHGDYAKEINEFLELLSLCHTVIPEKLEDGTINYQAASPDEEALVIAAHSLGRSYVSSKAGYSIVNIEGEPFEYKIVGVNEFNSDRKRMSVVIECMTDKTRPPVLYCKGADNMILERVVASKKEKDELTRSLYDFSVEGLRTLVLAKRELTEEQVRDFEKKWNTAKNAMSDRSLRLDEVAAEFEVDMELIGATAIEDKIQEGVPEAIADLMEGGLKVWVLTGDKQETAINIGFSCKLLTKDMDLIILNCNSADNVKYMLKKTLGKYVMCNNVEGNYYDVSRNSIQNGLTPNSNSIMRMLDQNDDDTNHVIMDIKKLNLGLVVDGATLTYIFADIDTIKYFSMISCLCHSVICCRVSPLQKAEVVRLVKHNFSFRPITLAIGDGANDVSMIQEAHVGVGVCGKEGLQAVNSSDYAVARFKFLLPLLFIHGRFNYQRISKVILYSFYKNFILVLPMFYFSFFNLYSGTTLYDSWILIFYNVFLTALPIVIVGTIDKDLAQDTILDNPVLYQDGIYSRLFNAKIFLKITIDAICHSLIVFFFVIYSSEKAVDSDGNSVDYTLIGTSAFYSVVLTASFIMMTYTRDFTLLFVIIILISPLIFLPYLFVYDYLKLPTKAMIGISIRFFNVLPIFLQWTLIPIICLIVNLVIDYSFSLWSPTKLDTLRRKANTKVMPEKLYQIGDEQQQATVELSHMRVGDYANNLQQVFNPKGLKMRGQEKVKNKNDYTMNTLTLTFNNEYLEKRFKRFITEKIIGFIRKMFIILAAGYLLWTIADLSTSTKTVFMMAIRIFLIALLGGLVGFTWTKAFIRWYEHFIIIVIIFAISAKIALEIYNQNDGSMSSALIPILTFVLFNVSTYKVFIINIISIIVYLIRVLTHYGTIYEGIDMGIIALDYAALLIGITSISAYVGYELERTKRIEYVLLKKLEYQFQKGQDILGNLLPRFVKDRVKQGVRYIAEDQGMVTVMFCDIYNFDKICATHTPHELIDLLDKFFAILDNLCEKHGVTKIETVNKTYLVCGGLKDSEENLSPELLSKNHSVRTVNMALDILKKIEPVYLKTGDKFSIKIGINTGSVIAGVVGEHKPQFSLVGDTINTASRMCSTVKCHDVIQISAETYKYVCDQKWEFIPNKVEAKGKGMLDTFLVSKKVRRRSKAREFTTFDQMPSVAHQQQPVNSSLVVDPNSSSVALLPFNGAANQVAPVTESVTAFEIDKIDINNFNKEDDDYLGLAGPVQWLTCNFKEAYAQHEYRVNSMAKDLKKYKIGLWITILIYIVLTIIFITGYKVKNSYGKPAEVGLRVICVFAMIVIALSTDKVYTHYMYPWMVMSVYISYTFISVVTFYYVGDSYFYVIVLEVMYSNVVINHIASLPFGHILIATICNFIHWLAVILDYQHFSVSIEATFFVFIFMMINAIVSFTREYQDRKTYNLNKLAQREIQNTEKLLNQMMPPQVVRNLKNDITTTDKYSNVTIIFADICGFTLYSSDKKPIEVVSMLSKLFSNFDHLCMINNVYKVHTIGDCYVVLSFSNSGDEEKERDPSKECSNMINMALDMVKSIKKTNRDKGTSLNMRIGMHTGEVIAGITGTNIVRYDIYGPDVDIANKMESGGAAGRINVSEVTKALLEQSHPTRFEYIFNKKIAHEPVNRTLNSFFIRPLVNEDIEF